MCTVSWMRLADGYELYCNRDERHTRKPALAPRVRSQRGVRIIAPQDGDFGGTWIVVNELGLTLCLLNRWNDSPAGEGQRDYRSRGWLVDELAACGDADELQQRLAQANLTDYRAFTLVVLEAGSRALVAEWSGRDLTCAHDGDERLPLVSSSFEAHGVCESRRALFSALTRSAELTGELLEDFHRGHAAAQGSGSPSAYTVCMHREDASTKSLSRIRVGPEEVSFAYAPGAPCQVSFLEPVVLARADHLAQRS